MNYGQAGFFRQVSGAQPGSTLLNSFGASFLCLPEGEAICGNGMRTVVNMQHLPRLTGK